MKDMRIEMERSGLWKWIDKHIAGDPADLVAMVEERFARGKKFAVICVAEGAHPTAGMLHLRIADAGNRTVDAEAFDAAATGNKTLSGATWPSAQRYPI